MEKSLIKTGDVFHCTGKGFFSKSIRIMTASSVSHTAIAIWVGDNLCIADAQKDGFQIRKFENWQIDFGYTFKVTRTRESKLEIRDRILSLVGTSPYDFESLILRQPKKIATTLLNKVRINDKEPWKYRGEKENKRLYCSEAVALCLGLPESYQMSPGELYDYCKTNHNLIYG